MEGSRQGSRSLALGMGASSHRRSYSRGASTSTRTADAPPLDARKRSVSRGKQPPARSLSQPCVESTDHVGPTRYEAGAAVHPRSTARRSSARGQRREAGRWLHCRRQGRAAALQHLDPADADRRRGVNGSARAWFVSGSRTASPGVGSLSRPRARTRCGSAPSTPSPNPR